MVPKLLAGAKGDARLKIARRRNVQMRSSMRAKIRAFTLVELLVVIGIISVLISFLLPALTAARDRAGAIACLAQARSLGQSFVMYNNDWRGKYPLIWYWEPSVGVGHNGWKSEHFAYYEVGGFYTWWTWKDGIYPYQKSMKGWQCPKQEYPLLDGTLAGVKYTIAGYTMNASAGGGGGNFIIDAGLPGNPDYVWEDAWQKNQWVADNRVKNRTSKVLIGCAAAGRRRDGAWCGGDPNGNFSADPAKWGVYSQYVYPNTPPFVNLLENWGKHKAGCPVVFMDQHGEFLTPTQNFCSLTGDSDKWLNVYK
jgi:prepilin-type N-terminal cleavage/methylation domain-containing protein